MYQTIVKYETSDCAFRVAERLAFEGCKCKLFKQFGAWHVAI